MTPLYNPGDRVLTTVDGAEVEATIVKITIDVEVRLPDGTTRWRASTRIRPTGAVPAAPPAPKAPEAVVVPLVKTPAPVSHATTPETAPAATGEGPESSTHSAPSTGPSSMESAPAGDAQAKTRNRRKGRR